MLNYEIRKQETGNGRPKTGRITSYNVCYTKLLRVTEAATIEYHNAATGLVTVMVTAVSGAQVATLTQALPAGKLTFTLSGLAAGSYAVTVCAAGSECQSTLVVSQNSGAAAPSLAYTGADQTAQYTFATLKKATALPAVSMDYTDGNLINFTAYMGQGKLEYKYLVVAADTTISFPFIGYTSFTAPDTVKYDSVITITVITSYSIHYTKLYDLSINT